MGTYDGYFVYTDRDTFYEALGDFTHDGDNERFLADIVYAEDNSTIEVRDGGGGVVTGRGETVPPGDGHRPPGASGVVEGEEVGLGGVRSLPSRGADASVTASQRHSVTVSQHPACHAPPPDYLSTLLLAPGFPDALPRRGSGAGA